LENLSGKPHLLIMDIMVFFQDDQGGGYFLAPAFTHTLVLPE